VTSRYTLQEILFFATQENNGDKIFAFESNDLIIKDLLLHKSAQLSSIA